MKNFDFANYREQLQNAVANFWKTRDEQQEKQKGKGVSDAGHRGSVTGGKQMDGFIELLKQVALDAGIWESCIYTKLTVLPGLVI